MDSPHAGIKGTDSLVQPKGINSLKYRNAILADKDLPRNPKPATSERSSNLQYDQLVTAITHSITVEINRSNNPAESRPSAQYCNRTISFRREPHPNEFLTSRDRKSVV